MILAIDPGSAKCGLAIVDEDARVRDQRVVKRGELVEQVRQFCAGQAAATIVIGDTGFGKTVARELSESAVKANLIFVSEKDSTLEARKRYWLENPPTGWLRLIPTSLRVPPVPVDGLAAVIIAQRYLNS